MAAQKVDTSEPLPSLSRVMPDAPLERMEDFRLPSLSHGTVLVGLDLRAEVVIETNENVLDSDDGVPRRQLGVGSNGAVPGETRNAKR